MSTRNISQLSTCVRQMVTSLLLVCVLPSGWAFARDAKVVVRQSDAPPHGGFVTVRLDGRANDMMDVGLPGTHLTVNGIPFDLIEKAGANNLFLKDAGWRNCEKDPSSYYSPYDGRADDDPRRFIFSVPVDDYAAVYLLAATEKGEEFSPVVSFRIGAIDGPRQTTYHDFSAEVPRTGETPRGVITVPGAKGSLFLVRVPLGKAISQDLKARWALDVDVTKELRLAVRRPDPCRYQIRPLGLPSGVHLFGMTFLASPMRMEVQAAEPGGIFNEPQTPTFDVSLRKMQGGRVRACSLEATATDHEGNVTTSESSEIDFGRLDTATVTLPVKVGRRGHYELAITLKNGRNPVLTRYTTFALLPPDTRQYRAQSPFGTWDFSGGHFTPSDPDLVGPLYVKAGLRYGMFGFSERDRQTYGVVKGNEAKASSKNMETMVATIRGDPNAPIPKRIMVFHETAISGSHITRVPDLFSGRPAYKFDEKETEKFKTLWEEAEQTAKAIRKDFPLTEIYFGNGNPMLVEEFLRKKFPKELLGSRGNEAGNFMRMPEAQPPDWIANGPGLWMDRTLLDAHGYTDTPLRQCYEMCYPGTNPGNLSLRTQASYFVRHMMHSLAWEIPIIRAGLITDVGNSYYFSNWGAAGLCHARPAVSPKPSYVACATMTQLLDGATFTRVVPVPSPIVYAVEFARKDKKHVTCLWTARGARPVLATLPPGKEAVVTDLMGNDTVITPGKEPVEITASPEPVFLTAVTPIGEIALGKPVLAGRPEGKTFLISPLDDLTQWTAETERSRELEMYSFMCPRRKGDFEYAGVDELEGEEKVVCVKPKLPVPGSEYLPMYSVLRHNEGVEIPDEPTQIGLMVNGNGGWGRIIFELEDAAGQRWASVGAEQRGKPTRWMADWMTPEEFAALETANLNDWNTDDPWGRSTINFEGWRYLQFPLPGNYPGERYHWPCSSQWRYSGDGVVKYPLKFKKLVITLRENVLHLKDYGPVARQEVYLKDLMVTYRPPEEAFAPE